MPTALADFGLQAAQGAVGTGMGLLLQKGQDRRQLEQQRKLQELEIGGQKQMVDYNYQKQLAMWKDTNFKAQMEQIEAAGLNPALLYGMGGAGGTTTGTPAGGVTGGRAAGHTGEAVMMAQTTAQMGLMRAQKELLEAQKEETLAKIPGHQKEAPLKEAQTSNLIQGLNNQKAEEALTKAQTMLLGSQDSKLKREEQELWRTQDDRVTIYAEQAKKTIEEAKQAVIQTGINQKTADEKVKILEGEAAGVLIHNTLMAAQAQESGAKAELSYEQAKAIGVELTQKWMSLSLHARETLITERVGKFYSAQSQRTYDNILKGVGTIMGSVSPAQKLAPTPGRNPIGFQY